MRSADTVALGPTTVEAHVYSALRILRKRLEGTRSLLKLFF